MATQTGKTHLYGVPATFVFYSANGIVVSGYVTPNLQSGSLSHSVEVDKIKSTTGEFTGLIHHGEALSCTFDCIPEGSVLDVGTFAGPVLSARLPAVGGNVVITGLPILAAGSFADAFNVNTAGSAPETSRWIYEGGGSIKGSSDSHWTMTLPLMRYPGIVGAAVGS
jgi:hypothetical protein